MKTIKPFITGMALLGALANAALGATNGVVNGQDFQSVIDASAPGDTLLVQPGVYPDASLNFNKPLTVLPTGTNGSPMEFLGMIQVTGAGASSFQSAYFASSVQTTNATVSFFDATFNGPVSANGGKLTMKRTLLNTTMTITNAALEALRMTNLSTVTAFATIGLNMPFLAVQCLFSNCSVIIINYNVWLGYNYFADSGSGYGDLQETGCNSIVIGNKFLSPNSFENDIIEIGGTLKAYNNFLTTTFYGSGNTFISLNSTTAEIANNTLSVSPSGNGNGGNYTLIDSGSNSVTFRENIIDCSNGNDAQSGCISASGGAGSVLFISYCDLDPLNSTALSGVLVPTVNCLTGVNPNLAADGTPSAGSPCLNAGPPDAIYNNRDGTRNTIGYTGGPYWNPTNYTNSNPMVFLLTGQQTLWKGVQTTIPINAAASAGH